MRLKQIIISLYFRYKEWKYKNIDAQNIPSNYQKKLAKRIRSKEIIRVAFIIYDIAKWRTEELYLRMLNNSRFDPILVPVFAYDDYSDYTSVTKKYSECIKTLEDKGYAYTPGKRNLSIDRLVHPDIVFYGEHYSALFDNGYTYQLGTHRDSLSCYVPYSMHNTVMTGTNNQMQSNLVWMAFIENQACKEDLKDIVYNKARNKVVTGIPIQDRFLKKDSFSYNWKHQSCPKKRIIWAPSHTITAPGIDNAYAQSTFLEIADEMLEIAQRFSNSIQWVFKPHPSLKRKLIDFWGVDKTERYYKAWESQEYSQLEEGQYIDLFMTSDAMIHDGMSFIVEYMYSNKPVMFIEKSNSDKDIYNTQTREALRLHYKGRSLKDIVNFIEFNVLANNDYLKQERIKYINTYLIPPYNRTASENIIKAILGEDEYNDL